MKSLSLSLFIVLLFTGCSPHIGIGGVAVSGDGSVASEVLADSETGIHGSIAMGI